MKTIAITIDEHTLARVDRIGGGRARSRLIREAVQEYLARVERVAEEERESAVLRRNRHRLAQQTRALVREQSKP
jgi:metal-responsive CopG/Arc/MetJ family transcriptional regulator